MRTRKTKEDKAREEKEKRLEEILEKLPEEEMEEVLTFYEKEIANAQRKTKQETEKKYLRRYKLLHNSIGSITSSRKLKVLMHNITAHIVGKRLPYDAATLSLVEYEEGRPYLVAKCHVNPSQTKKEEILAQKEYRIPLDEVVEDSVGYRVVKTGKTEGVLDTGTIAPKKKNQGMGSYVTAPIIDELADRNVIGTISFYKKQKNGFDDLDESTVKDIAVYLGLVLHGIRSDEEKEETQKDEDHKHYTQSENYLKLIEGASTVATSKILILQSQLAEYNLIELLDDLQSADKAKQTTAREKILEYSAAMQSLERVLDELGTIEMSTHEASRTLKQLMYSRGYKLEGDSLPKPVEKE